jgi:predicted aspartyl protease/lipoprotein NlpI
MAFMRLLLAALLAAMALPAAAQSCKLVRIAEWPVTFKRNLPTIEGEINGKKVSVLLDTGAYASIITKSTAEKLGLSTRATAEIMSGVGGNSRVLVTRIEELRLGGASRQDFRVRVGGERPIPGVDFILGDDFFNVVDIEFDYAKGVVRLFQPEDCKNTFLGYWDKNAVVVEMENDKKIVVPIRVNGREGTALIDSGASSSSVGQHFAEKLGITPKTPGVVPAGCSSGVGAELVGNWIATFETVDIGTERIRDPRLRMSDFMGDRAYTRSAFDMLIGTDFLRTHRMYVSRSQRKVYFTHIGGLVFPATPSLECEERSRNPAEARAAYDKAIAENPRDVKALVSRAMLRSRERDDKGALADLDAAIQVEPNNAYALGLRSSAKVALKDYDGALADTEAAIANGMRTAPAYANRASIRLAQGDREGAMREYDETLKLDPRHPVALRARGRHNFLAGRFEAAENDYVVLVGTPQGSSFDALWLSLSRSRRGLDGRAVLEQQLGTSKDEWPAPVMQYLTGRIDATQLMAAAANPDEKKRREHECEARFYMAEHFLGAGKPMEARPLLEKARDECPKDYIEHQGAVAELARLN